MSTPLAALREKLTHVHETEDVSFAQLERLIETCGDRRGAPYNGRAARIDRRKLKAISDGKDAALSFTQMGALDAFLTSRFGSRFSALFEPPDLLSAVVAQRRATVFIGAQPRDAKSAHLNTLSTWDFRATRDLLAAIHRTGVGVEVDFEDVLFEWPAGGATPEWAALLDRPGNAAAVISLGSHRSSPVSEYMLARMFGVTPFQRTTTKVPFHFVWDHDGAASAFSRSFSEIADAANKRFGKTPAERRPWALQIDGQPHFLERFVAKSNAYGVLAAQRRATGPRTSQVWVVVAGLSGPGTVTAARFIDYLDFRIPDCEDGRHSPVVWMAVESDVVLSRARGDRRELVPETHRRLSGPHVWSEAIR